MDDKIILKKGMDMTKHNKVVIFVSAVVATSLFYTYPLKAAEMNDNPSLTAGVGDILESPISQEECMEEKETIETKSEEISDNRWNIELSDADKELLARIVWLEARGESDKGQQAVIAITFNRMKDPYFEGTLTEVLSAKNQYTSWQSRDSAEPTEKKYTNINMVLNGSVDKDDSLANRLYFNTVTNSPTAIKIGNHYFW